MPDSASALVAGVPVDPVDLRATLTILAPAQAVGWPEQPAGHGAPNRQRVPHSGPTLKPVPTVPLFPLQAVLVPGLVLPLHIFEPRYRLMIRTLAESPGEERGFGIVAIRPGADPEAEGLAALYQVGTMARILDVDPLPDGRFDIMTVGARRFSIVSLVPGLPYLRAEVTLHGEPVGNPGRAAVLARAATALLRQYRSLIAAWGVIEVAEIEDLPQDPVALSHLVCSAIVTDVPERQRLLRTPDAERRLAAACGVLRREIALMSALPSMPAVDLAAARPCRN